MAATVRRAEGVAASEARAAGAMGLAARVAWAIRVAAMVEDRSTCRAAPLQSPQLYPDDDAQCDAHTSQQHPPAAESARRSCDAATRFAKTLGGGRANGRAATAVMRCVPLHHDPGGASQAAIGRRGDMVVVVPNLLTVTSRPAFPSPPPPSHR
eukprot:scaffold62981_cov60-Phaeocystis_antarctica.AAC.1